MRTGISLELTPANRLHLEGIIRNRNAPQKHVWRAAIVLHSADGLGTVEIMRRTGKSKTCVWRWQERFAAEGVDGLLRDKTRPSRLPPLPQEVIDKVLALTATEPPHEATHWTSIGMAKAVGISASSVQRIWRAHGLAPHRMRQFKLSKDPAFATKLRDVVGLYVDPPAHAVVLSVDEKSQIQALDRTSGLRLTFESGGGFPAGLGHASLRHAPWDQHRTHPRRSPSPGGDHPQPQRSAETCLARRDRAVVGRRPGHGHDHAPDGQVQDLRVALAGTLRRRGRGGPAA
jgi:transposase